MVSASPSVGKEQLHDVIDSPLFSRVHFTRFESGHCYLECHSDDDIEETANIITTGPTVSAGITTTLENCCQQVKVIHSEENDDYHDDTILSELQDCVGHAVRFPRASREIPVVASFFKSNVVANNRNNPTFTRVRWQNGTNTITTHPEFDTTNAYLEGVGMHRTLHWSPFASSSISTSLTYYLHLYLPAGLILNIEEQQQGSSIFAHPPVIDQEEPSFAAIPHGLVIRMGEGNDNHISQLSLHSRYPVPGESTTSTSVFLPIPRSSSSSSNTPTLLEWDVAAPSSKDTWPVLVLTVGLALWGALVTGRDLRRVVRWV